MWKIKIYAGGEGYPDSQSIWKQPSWPTYCHLWGALRGRPVPPSDLRDSLPVPGTPLRKWKRHHWRKPPRPQPEAPPATTAGVRVRCLSQVVVVLQVLPALVLPKGPLRPVLPAQFCPIPLFPSPDHAQEAPHTQGPGTGSVLGATLRHVSSANLSAPLRGCLQQPADVCRAWAFISELMSGEACWRARTPPPIWQPFPTRVVSEGTVLNRISILYRVIMRHPSPSGGIIRGQLEPLSQKT